MHTDKIESSVSPVSTSTTGTPSATRKNRNSQQRNRRRLIAAGATVLSAGLLVGSIYLDDAATPPANAISASAAEGVQSSSHIQLTSFLTPNRERTHEYAESTIASANQVIASAQGKVDATPLVSSVASLGNYRSLDSVTIASLAKTTQTTAQSVQAAAAEVDRVAAEAAAAAQAAAEAQAAEAAAAEAAARATAQAAADAAALAASSASKTPAAAKAVARSMASSNYGWGEGEFSCLVNLWQKESGWSYTAYNSNGGATGIPQALPGSKMASAGSDWQTNPSTQIAWGLQYIKSSYGSPCSAWSHSQAMNWY